MRLSARRNFKPPAASTGGDSYRESAAAQKIILIGREATQPFVLRAYPSLVPRTLYPRNHRYVRYAFVMQRRVKGG